MKEKTTTVTPDSKQGETVIIRIKKYEQFIFF